MAGMVEWSMSERQLAAFERRLARWQGRPLVDRLRRGNLAAAQYLARPIRAAAPVGPTGNLRRSVKARTPRRSALLGNVAVGASRRLGGAGGTYAAVAALVGPVSPHRHLVIRGHRIVTRGGRDTGRRSRANPFVDRAVAAHRDDALRIVGRALFGG